VLAPSPLRPEDPMTDTPPRPAARRRSRFAQLIARIAAAVRAANAGNVPF